MGRSIEELRAKEEAIIKYKEENFEKLKKELLNKEMNFEDLDDLLQIKGYFSMYDYSIVECNKRNFNVVYKAIDTEYDYDLELSYVITGCNLSGEEAAYVTITDVQKNLTESSNMKKGVNELSKILLNNELYYRLFDRMLEDSGYYSVIDNGVTSEIKKNSKVVCTAVDTNKSEIEISFEITKNNGPDEVEEGFYLRVTDIKRI